MANRIAKSNRPTVRHGIMLACLLLIVFYLGIQPTASYQNGIFLDAEKYYDMARLSAEGRPIQGLKPFVYRVALPWLVGKLAAENTLGGFKLANLVFGLLALWFFILLLEQLFEQWWIVALLSVLLVTNINSPFRFNLFYPIMVDPPLLFFCTVILYLDIRFRATSCRTVLLVSLLSLVGALFREAVLLAPMAALVASPLGNPNGRSRASRALSRCLPLLSGFAGLLVARIIVSPEGAYSFDGQILSMLRVYWHDPLSFLLTPLVTYGPFLLLPIVFFSRNTWRFFQSTPVLPVFGLGVLIMTLIGGYHGVRLMFWGYVFVLPVIGVALNDLICHRSRRTCFCILLPVAVAQVLAFNPLGVIPDITGSEQPGLPEFYLLYPYGEHVHYDHLVPLAMAGSLRRLVLVQYLILGLYLLLVRLIGCGARLRRAAQATRR